MAHTKPTDTDAKKASDAFNELKKLVATNQGGSSPRQQQVLDIVNAKSIAFSKFVEDVQSGKRKPEFTTEIIASQDAIASELGIQGPQVNGILRALVKKHADIIRVKLPKGSGRPVFSYYNTAKLSDPAVELLTSALKRAATT